jgi:hypothetical protein
MMPTTIVSMAILLQLLAETNVERANEKKRRNDSDED